MYVAESHREYIKDKTIISSSSDVYKELKDIADESKEHFILICLDGANAIIKKETVSVGTLNQTLVHPREIYRTAIIENSAAIVVAHNHPSNILTASKEDIEVTKKLKKAGEIIGIELLDHLIITKNGYVSFKNEDLL